MVLEGYIYGRTKTKEVISMKRRLLKRVAVAVMPFVIKGAKNYWRKRKMTKSLMK